MVRSDPLLRCCGSPLGRQKDQALVVSATLYEPGLLGVADRLLKVRIRKADVTADAFSSPPGMRAVDGEAVKLGDERHRALETVLGDHQPMVPQWHAACQPTGGQSQVLGTQALAKLSHT
jgi:hypothetical protein